MQKKTIGLLPLWIISIAFFLALVFAVSPPDVNLLSPNNGAVFNTTNNINFSCNATTNATLRKIDIYTTLNGPFSKTNTSCFGELCADSSTALLFHFNNNSLVGENGTLVYDWSGNGNNATVIGATFNATGGRFSGAFEFDGTANKYMKISDSNSIRLAPAGSIEFWVKPASSSDGYIFLKGPPDSTCAQSSYDVKLFGGTVILDLNGDYSILLTSGDSYQSTGTVTPGVWSQIVYTWNGSWVDIYINGAQDSPPQPQTHAISSNTYNLWIGATNDPSCSSYPTYPYFNGAIDELAIYNRQLTSQEVSEHYGRTLLNNATRNWTMSNVSDGAYSWTCRTEDNESQGAWGANRTFYVDLHTPPDVNSITLSPNSSDDVDPGVTLRVTANITDTSGVSSAILQYKNPNEAFFRNATMAYDNSSKLYNTSFTPPLADNGLWIYRIWTNDTLGNAGTSSEKNISVEFDHTWILSVINSTGGVASGFGTISALNGSTVQIGTVIINNTGDSLLNFDLTGNPAILTYNASEPFDLYAKNATSVKVYATAPQQEGEWPVQLIINTSSAATPSGAAVNGVIVPFKGGPYLDVSIQNYQPTVSHNQEINISARIKNLGNETATGVFANWTFPDGWIVLSGNISDSLGNITSSAMKWSNITVKISTALASVGTFENGISVTAKSGENATGTDSKTVSVICRNADGICGNGCSYSSDSDCPVPAATGGPTGISTPAATGGGKAPVQTYGISLGAPDKIDASRGSPVRFRINITNPNKDTRVENITYSVSGYSQVLTFAEPKAISALSFGETKTIMFRLEVPNYTRYGEYPLEVTAYGKGTSNGAENATGVSASRKLTLAVRSATENETRSIIGEASKSIESLAAHNIAAPKLLQMLEDATVSLKKWDYDAAKELAVKALEAGRSAAKSYASLRQVEGAISEADKYGVDARETKKMYALAEAAFERGDYARAEERANNAMLAAAIEASAKVSILRFIHTYYREIILASAMLAAALFFIYRKIAAEAIMRKIARLGKEEEAIRKLIADAKKEYFEKRSITKADYRRTIYGYETHMNEIKKARSQMILRLAGLARPEKVIEGFKKEEKRLLGLIESAQKDYFESGKISKAHYHGTMRELNAELAEVRLGIEELAGRKLEKNKPPALALLFAALLLMFLGAAAHAAADAAGATGAISQAEADIIEMQKAGLSIALANDTLNEARLLYSKGNYASAESLAKYVGAIKKTSASTYALVDDAEGKIFEAEKEGLNVADAKNDFDAGLSALENSDYPGAEELLNSAISRADKAMADAAMEGALERTWLSDAWGFALQKKKQIAVLLVSIAAAYAAAKKKYKSMKRANRIRHLEDEEKAASKMIRELQKKYFLDGEASRAEYATGVKRYGEIILRAKKDISVLRDAEKKGKA